MTRLHQLVSVTPIRSAPGRPVVTILSAQCAAKRVNEVTPGLVKKCPTPQDFAYAKDQTAGPK